MKIVKLQSANVKRLSAVEVIPGDSAVVVVGGLNGAGKSSVLDSIAYALGGEKLVPSEPIRRGELEARVTLELGDITVTRKFYREYLPCNCTNLDGPHSDDCASKKFGDTKSALLVTNKDGARYPSPQAMLDKLLGKLTFDPLAFSKDEPAKQAETLRKLTNLDFSLLNSKRVELYNERTMVNRSLKTQESIYSASKHYPEAPAEEISIQEISQEMLRAEELRTIKGEASRNVAVVMYSLDKLNEAVQRIQGEIKELEKQLNNRREALIEKVRGVEIETAKLDAAKAAEEEAAAAVPDTTAISKRLRDAEEMNQKVRANVARANIEKRYTELQTQADALTQKIQEIDAKKAQTIATTKFPVEGLGFADDEVTFNGLPFNQASSSEQLRVSVAIAFALNPKLRVLLVRNGNLLDAAHQKMLAEMAAEANAQVWMEYVTDDAEHVSVMIEDGHVAHALTS